MSLVQLWFAKATVRQAVLIALIVGPFLTIINQYGAIASGSFGGRFLQKLGLTFLVPYRVSSLSSALAGAASRTGRRTRKVIVMVYPIAGRQLFFRVPDSWCLECDLTLRTIRQVFAELGDPQQMELGIRPWLTWLPLALLHGGWHPPVVFTNGKRFSQGVVPDKDVLTVLTDCVKRAIQQVEN